MAKPDFVNNRFFIPAVALLMIVLGFALLVMNWQALLHGEPYREGPSCWVAPFLGFLGLALLLGPPEEKAFIDRYGERWRWWRTLRLRFAQILFAIGVLGGAANWVVILFYPDRLIDFLNLLPLG